MLPAPYVKVYLVSGKKCVDKMKTSTARRTLDPLYQQQLVFKQSYSGCVLQVSKRRDRLDRVSHTRFNNIIFHLGDRLGRLWPHREESIYGRGTDNA